MTKIILIAYLLVASSFVGASPMEHTMSMKERLRISLWVEGLEEKPKAKTEISQKRLPEEIERPLRKW
jgi:hypothetical protein